jgi:hypothetical protein
MTINSKSALRPVDVRPVGRLPSAGTVDALGVAVRGSTTCLRPWPKSAEERAMDEVEGDEFVCPWAQVREDGSHMLGARVDRRLARSS